jgi:hypothetical protein
MGTEPLANDHVVNPQQRQVRVISEAGRLLHRPTEVGEHDCPHRRGCVRGPRRVLRLRAQQRVQGDVRIDLDDRARELAVGFLMHCLESLLGRPLREAEDRTVGRIEPVRVVTNTMSLLDLEIPHVQVGELFRSDPGSVMAVHVQGHDRSIRKTRSPMTSTRAPSP